MKLNTKIRSIDLISSKEKMHFDSEGTFPINYGNNFINDSEHINFHSEIELIEDRLSFFIEVNFIYQRNCGRCLVTSNNEDRSSLTKVLNIKEDNDYEIRYEDEYFDLSPFISEIIIEKMDINYICAQKCKGLCSFCGINKNNLSCNHNEKKLKESPFSSLSQLDL